jgi:hypothetical protein
LAARCPVPRDGVEVRSSELVGEVSSPLPSADAIIERLDA